MCAHGITIDQHGGLHFLLDRQAFKKLVKNTFAACIHAPQKYITKFESSNNNTVSKQILSREQLLENKVLFLHLSEQAGKCFYSANIFMVHRGFSLELFNGLIR